MISDADREAIEASVAAMDIDAWRPLSSAERDLVGRALHMPTAPDERDEVPA